jgi:hypothetical protein
VAGGRSLVADRRWPIADGRWPIADGRWPVADRRWPVAGGRQLPVTSSKKARRGLFELELTTEKLAQSR